MWALPHAEGDSSSCSPDNACWPLTQGAPKNPLQSGFSSKQEYGPDLPHPLPTKASEQPTCPLQAISRAPEDQGSICFCLNTGQTDVTNKQQLGIVLICLDWRYQQTRHYRTHLTSLYSQLYGHSPHLPTPPNSNLSCCYPIRKVIPELFFFLFFFFFIHRTLLVTSQPKFINMQFICIWYHTRIII